MSPTGFAPKLFHKAALEGDEDSSLAGEIRSALAEKKQRIVGIVINAVDDHLDKGEQTDPLWTLQHIRVLEPILAEARSAGRCVVLLSDHGHVLDRQTEFHEGSDGLRWRRPGGAVRSDEVEITSPRVVIPEGNRIVVPWSEHVRYGAKKNGYHGGVCPQEMLIPISVLWPALDPPEGFADLPVDLPVWWSEPTVALPIPTAVELPPPPKKGKPLPLFDELEKRPVVTAKEEAWIKALLECELFAAQRRLAGRVQIEDEVLRRLLSTLANRGGSMTVPALAGALGEPEHRLRGRLAIIQRMLNVEGYPILDRQDVSNTVVLNVPLLKKQFELGE